MAPCFSAAGRGRHLASVTEMFHYVENTLMTLGRQEEENVTPEFVTCTICKMCLVSKVISQYSGRSEQYVNAEGAFQRSLFAVQDNNFIFFLLNYPPSLPWCSYSVSQR